MPIKLSKDKWIFEQDSCHKDIFNTVECDEQITGLIEKQVCVRACVRERERERVTYDKEKQTTETYSPWHF